MAAEAGKPDRLSNRDVAAYWRTADMLQIVDANRFRIIAFQNAAEAIRTLGQDMRVVHEGKLQTISGGQGIAGALDEPLTEGRGGSTAQGEDSSRRGGDDSHPGCGAEDGEAAMDEPGITSVEELRCGGSRSHP